MRQTLVCRRFNYAFESNGRLNDVTVFGALASFIPSGRGRLFRSSLFRWTSSPYDKAYEVLAFAC